MFWDLLQQIQIMSNASKAEAVDDRVAALEAEVAVLRRTLEQLMRRLESQSTAAEATGTITEDSIQAVLSEKRPAD